MTVHHPWTARADAQARDIQLRTLVLWATVVRRLISSTNVRRDALEDQVDFLLAVGLQVGHKLPQALAEGACAVALAPLGLVHIGLQSTRLLHEVTIMLAQTLD